MRTLTLLTMALLAAMPLGCRDTPEAERAEERADQNWEQVKDSFVRAMDAEGERMKQNLASWDEEAAAAVARADAETQQALDNAERETEEAMRNAQMKMAEARRATAEEWDEAQREAKAAWEDAKDAYSSYEERLDRLDVDVDVDTRPDPVDAD